MRTRLIWTLFSLAVFAQLAVPAWVVVNKERTLAEGQQLRVRCGILDPYDPVRGKYVALHFELGPMQQSPIWNMGSGQPRYLTFTVDGEGYLRGETIATSPPMSGEYITLDPSTSARAGLPCNRFYMDENLAPRADAFIRTTKDIVWASVRVRKGEVTLENIYVNQTPLAQYLTEHAEAGAVR